MSDTYDNARTTQTPQQDDTFTRRLLDRLKALYGTLGEAHQELAMLGERQFGPNPPNTGSGKDGSPPDPLGRVGEAQVLLDRLETRAALIVNQASALNSRI